MSSVLLRSRHNEADAYFSKAPIIHFKMSIWTVLHWIVTIVNNHFRYSFEFQSGTLLSGI
jgi:hypothetical protein